MYDYDNKAVATKQECAWISATWFRDTGYNLEQYILNLRNNSSKVILKDQIKLIIFYMDSLE